MAQWTEEEAARRIKQAKADKQASDPIYQEAMQLAFPDRENFTRQAEGASKAARNWDSSVTVSVIRSANRLSADWTPQFQSWVEIGLGPAARVMSNEAYFNTTGKSKEDAQAEFEIVSGLLNAVFNGPGFATASNELYIDWLFGQGGMKIMPSEGNVDEPVLFSSMPLSHFYSYEGANGKLDTWFFWHEKRSDVITTEWSDARLPDGFEMMKNGKPHMCKLGSVVYYDRDERERPYRYEVFMLHGNKARRIVERQFRHSPFVTPRHTSLAGENRGRGPVIFAIPDIRTANKIVELTLRAAIVAVSGIYTAVDNGIMGPINLKPLSVIKVRRNGGPDGPSLARLDVPQRIDFGEILLEKLQENIKKVLGDRSLPPEAGPIRSATEFVQRARELIADQAGGLGRLYAEFIIPMTQRVIDILEDKAILPERLIIDQFMVEVRMTSPMARSEAMADVENIVRFIEILKVLGGDELAAYEINMNEASSMIGDLMDVSRKVRNTAEQKKKIEKGLAQIKAAEMGADPNEAAAVVEREQANE